MTRWDRRWQPYVDADEVHSFNDRFILPLHIPDPLSMTRAAISSSSMVAKVNCYWRDVKVLFYEVDGKSSYRELCPDGWPRSFCPKQNLSTPKSHFENDWRAGTTSTTWARRTRGYMQWRWSYLTGKGRFAPWALSMRPKRFLKIVCHLPD